MEFLAYVAIGAAIALLAPWFERTYRARYGDDNGDGETRFLVDFLGGMTGLFVLFLVGAGVWYLIFER